MWSTDRKYQLHLQRIPRRLRHYVLTMSSTIHTRTLHVLRKCMCPKLINIHDFDIIYSSVDRTTPGSWSLIACRPRSCPIGSPRQLESYRIHVPLLGLLLAEMAAILRKPVSQKCLFGADSAIKLQQLLLSRPTNLARNAPVRPTLH